MGWRPSADAGAAQIVKNSPTGRKRAVLLACAHLTAP
jgi:hypothetical protein